MTSSHGLTSFDHIWKKVVFPVSQTVLTESDPDFAGACGLRLRSSEEWKEELCHEYRNLRRQLKDICYGPTDHRSPEELLDGRKIAAILCSALVSRKGLLFNTEEAKKFAAAKKKALSDPVSFNLWAVGNVYANYKLAFCASLQLVYLTLMRDLLVEAGLDEKNKKLQTPRTSEQETARRLAKALNKRGHLAPYLRRLPPRGDSFDVNIVIGLARTDISVKDLDMFLFAMQLYQIEEHTMDLLWEDLTKEEKTAPR